VLVGVLKS
jgi:hypothetical protein